MKTRHFARLGASLTALTLAASALAPAQGQDGGSVSDFQLPATQPTPRGQAQGPVVDGIAPPRAPRPTPTRAAAPPPVVAEPTPAPTATASPRPAGSATPRAEESRAAEDRVRDEPAREAEDAAATPEEAATRQPDTAANAPPLTASPAPSPAARPVEPVSGGITWWIWLAALLAVGAIGAAAGWFWRGRRAEAPLNVPLIERPRVPETLPEPSGPPAELPKVALTRKDREPAPQPQPAAPLVADDEELGPSPESPLRVALEPARLSVSLLNATLAYRILLTNKGEEPLSNISIDGDMVSAHASLPQEEQLAAPNSKLENRHLVRSLAPGETKVVRGEFALPLPLIRPIRKGEATLFVPLARLRVVAGGGDAQILVQTSVVGQRSQRPGGGLRPFRLDLGPRIYSELGQRAFA